MATTHDATRQQLDELDALLQKMLALPVAQIEEALPTPKSAAVPAPRPAAPLAPPPSPPKFPPATVAYGMPPAADFAASSATAPPPEPVPAAPPRPWAIDLNPRQNSSVLGGRSPLLGAAPEPPAERPSPTALLSVTPLPTPISEPLPKPTPRRAAAAVAAVPLHLRPLAAVSRRFDEFMAGFGPLGRLVISPAGRGLMGYAGLAMLAASAAVCLLAWVGWSW